MTSATIIGGNFAGITAAKILTKANIKVTIISPNETAYFNLTIPRLITEPHQIDDCLFPISTYFKPHESVNHIAGIVTELDADNNQLRVQLNGSKSEGEGEGEGDGEAEIKTIDYENLVIASGSRAVVKCFKIIDSTTTTVNELKQLAKNVNAAKTVGIIGGNTLGVELAADIQSQFPHKTVDLYNSNSRLLSFMPEGGSKHAETTLKHYGTNIFNNTRVDSYTDETITIKGNQVNHYDVVIPALGVTPNTGFIPNTMLNDKGYLKTDEYFQVDGYNNILGFGEVNDITENNIHDIVLFQGRTLKKSVQSNFLGNLESKLHGYSKGGLSIMVALGKDNGLGYWSGWRLPNFIVRKFKSEKYMINKLKDFY